MFDSISIKAYAKINLSLDVLRKREDGYHDIESLMQAVDMCDNMVVARGEVGALPADAGSQCGSALGIAAGAAISAERSDRLDAKLGSFDYIDVELPQAIIRLYMNAEGFKPDEHNLAIKGAKRFFEAFESKFGEEERATWRSEVARGAGDLSEEGSAQERSERLETELEARNCSKERLSVVVDKRLPIAAGIAGGSGNAAGAMLGLNAIMGYPLSLEELMAAGSKVGADVPFSIMLNAAMNRDTLEELAGIERASVAADITGIGEIVDPREPIERVVLIANPGVSVSTKEVYEAIDSIPEDRRPRQGLWHNIMEEYTLEAYPEAKELKTTLDSLHAEHVLMSGSGPTMVAYYTAEETARQDYESLMKDGSLDERWRIWLTTTGKEPRHDGFSVKGAETP